MKLPAEHKAVVQLFFFAFAYSLFPACMLTIWHMCPVYLTMCWQLCVFPTPAFPFCSADCLTEVTAQNVFTGLEVPVIISHKEAFDGYLDTVIGELLDLCGQVVVASRTS